MTEAKLRAREEREIDLKDLFIEILLHWRGLILAIIIGALLLGGYSFYSSYKENKAAIAQNIATEEQKKESANSEEAGGFTEADEARLAEIESTLTYASKAKVNKYLLQKEQLEDLENYKNASLFMNVDLTKLPKGDITLRVVANNDNIALFEDAYEKLLASSEVLEVLKEKVGIAGDAAERVEIASNEGKEEATGIIHVITYGSSMEECSEENKAICDYLTDKASELEAALGKHEIVLVSESVSEVCDYDRINVKEGLLVSLATLNDELPATEAKLTEEEKDYLALKNKELQQLKTDEEVSEETEDEIVIPPVEISKKKTLIGAAAGLVVYGLLICMIYIFSGKIKDSDDFYSLFGLKNLGKIYGERKFKFLGKSLDKKIYSLKRGGRKNVSRAEAENVIAINVAASAKTEEIKILGIVASLADNEFVAKIVDKAEKEGISCRKLGDFNYSTAETEALSDVDAAILLAKPGESRYNELWDTIEILENRGIKVLGGVVG